jgi:glycosyltransferase involved in cell wall biosynthesis
MVRLGIAIVIPALNEAGTIAEVVGAASTYGQAVVVDDGSSDATAQLAQEAGAVVVSHGTNRGYDAALDSGFRRASELNYDVIITADADGQHNPALLEQFIAGIDGGADVVVGIRSRRQRIAEHIFAWYTKLAFGIADPMCGMKAYRTVVYRQLGHFDSYGSIGSELAIFAARHKFKITEVQIQVRDREGVSRFGRVLSGNYKILRAMFLTIFRR